jgi:archaellum biogenesis protein FlaJ (TadC family)
MFYENKLYFNLILALMCNYNSFKVSLIMVPLLFLPALAVQVYWISSHKDSLNDEPKSKTRLVSGLFALFAMVLGFAATHFYLTQKDLCKITIDKFMIAR